ncbi:MAG TPA: hypothetical protein VHJ99_11330 [Candidatus Dormibacteraeota bacterium]|nr:hypothetical protein [Candidatus Dormibacteraeota bacterium]
MLPQVRPDDHVILDIPGEAVELVDDDVRDRVVGRNLLQHHLEHRPVHRARGLTAVGVLARHKPTLVGDEADAGLALGIKAESLGLLLGGDAQVDERALHLFGFSRLTR